MSGAEGRRWADMSVYPDVDPERTGPAARLCRLSAAIGDVPDDACAPADWERMVARATRTETESRTDCRTENRTES
ncbi:hypothetical protein DEJ49_04095 [Streptomyces venezuelae]|uniref:Uncharacterized protein n=1 Tax=Streptomyces venezuelae TaxID=54571 RepID=A0A5P2CG33_STRVZ|nr:hypothetical protein [Streptomyces venezuelae]QES40271.1 hypothetical protein DEJ49_04095 [Streptomyces venezuelae]